MRKLDALIAGSTGYIGIQLIRLLLKHKNVNIKYLCGNKSIGKKISFYDKSLKSKKLPKILKFNKKYLNNVDVIFTALPNGEAQQISKYLLKRNTLIDLAADFRLTKSSEYKRWYNQKHKAINNIKKSIYSLPEISGNKIKKYNIIGCPGCYPTSILLPLIPLIKNKSIQTKNIIIDSKSGYSGAGKNFLKKFNSKNFYSSCASYSVYKHRHMAEIDQELKISNYSFNPHIIPTYRGIISSIYIDVKQNNIAGRFFKILKNFYKNKYFVQIKGLNKNLGTNDVLNTNKCQITVNKSRNSKKIIIFSVIDNLVKGAAGQAIQNMNLLCNLKENKGLR